MNSRFFLSHEQCQQTKQKIDSHPSVHWGSSAAKGRAPSPLRGAGIALTY